MAIMRQFKPEQLRSGSYSISGSFSGSFQGDGSKVLGVITSSYAHNADLLDNRDSTTYANTGSNIFVGQQVITGSVFITGSQVINGNLNVSNNIIASGSTVFGDSAADTHQFTGSLLLTASHISTVDYIDFNPNVAAPGFNTGRLHWTDDTKTLQLDTDVNGFELEIGHQSTIRGRNTNSFTLTKGTVVYINGESGNRPTFATASWEDDSRSASTIGIIVQDIISNQTGYAVTNGLIRGINTNAFSPGTQLYLSASGQYTSTVPISPRHEVRLGKTITQANQGIIYIDIMNGYEIGELHDVLITSASNGDLISWDSGSRVWKNTKTLSGSYGISGSLNVTSATGSFTGSFTGNGSGLFSGSFSGSFSANLQEITDNGSVTTNAITASGVQTNNLHVIGNATVTGSLTVSGSNTFKNIGPAQFTGSVDITGSATLNGSPLVTNAVFYPFTASYIQDSASFNSRILNNSSSIVILSSSFLSTSSSLNIRVTDLENFSSSLDSTYATDAQLNAATASLSSSIAFLSSSYLQSSSSFDSRILNNSASIATLSGSYLQDSASFSSRITTNTNNVNTLTLKTGSYATTASNIFFGNQTINGNITVNGTASVALLYTTYETASVIYSSGSTKFGDTADDTHQFTGSLFVHDGTYDVLDTATRVLRSSDGVTSVDWETRQLKAYDAFSVEFAKLDWLNSLTYAQDGGQSIDWEQRLLIGTSGVFPALNWSAGTLHNGAATTLNWQTGVLITYPGAISIDWTNRQLRAGTGISPDTTLSVDWHNRKLYNAAGSVILDWQNQIFTGSLVGTASWASNAVTSSYVQTAQTASYILQAVSSSFASTASHAPNFANTDLTFNGNRTHNTNGNYLWLQTSGSLNGSLIYMDSTNWIDVGWVNPANYTRWSPTNIQFYQNGVSRIHITGSETIINDSGTDADFRVEGDTDANLLFTDASTDRVAIGKNTPNAKLDVNGNAIITGSLTVTNGITGSLFGTASWASNAVTASFITASGVFGPFGANSVISSSYALTASYALNAGAGGAINTGSFLTTASISGDTITFTKGDGSTFPIIVPSGSGGGGSGSAFPYTGSAIITGSLIVTGSVAVTQNITGSRMLLSSSNGTTSGSTLTLYGSGSAQPVFTVQGSQGELFTITDSLSGSLFAVNDISGLPILEVFSDNTTLMGSYLDPMLITTVKVTQTNSGSFTVYSLPTASYDTAFFEYSVKSGSNARAGTIMAIQAGTTVNFTETTTTDIGNTSAVSFIVVVTGSNFALTGSSSTGLWTTKCIIRGI
jgi:hypothetical protein